MKGLAKFRDPRSSSLKLCDHASDHANEGIGLNCTRPHSTCQRVILIPVWAANRLLCLKPPTQPQNIRSKAPARLPILSHTCTLKLRQFMEGWLQARHYHCRTRTFASQISREAFPAHRSLNQLHNNMINRSRNILWSYISTDWCQPFISQRYQKVVWCDGYAHTPPRFEFTFPCKKQWGCSWNEPMCHGSKVTKKVGKYCKAH